MEDLDESRSDASLTRALDRVRAAMDRRSFIVRNMASQPATENQRPSLEDASQATQSAISVHSQRSKSRQRTATRTPICVATREPDGTLGNFLLADTELDLDEPFLPMRPTRTGFTDEKAKELFAKYRLNDISWTRLPMQQPPTRMRRVEKPVRLRVQWICHACNTRFGAANICPSCSHRKCQACSRRPARRVGELIDATRRQMEQEEQDRKYAAAMPQPVLAPGALVADPLYCRYREQPAATIQPESISHSSYPPRTPSAAAPDVGITVEDQDPDTFALPTINYPRSRSAAGFKAKAQIGCPDCAHEGCDRCLRSPSKRRGWPRDSIHETGEDESAAQSIQRVYRRARLRVRYICERCRTPFLESERCNECGHDRCGRCHRDPPKRAPHPHEPDLLQAVIGHLAGHDDDSATSPSPAGFAASAA